MEKNPTFLLVVAAAITGPDGRVLLQQRPFSKRHGGLWEFPGGKVDPGEGPQQALCREIAEELTIALDPERLLPIAFAETEAEEGHPALVLMLYRSDRWSGAVEALEGQEWGWFTLAQAAELALAPMDRDLMKKL